MAQLGLSDGRSLLETAARDKRSENWTERLVGLAALDDSGVITEITHVLHDSDEATKGKLVWAIARFGNERLKNLAFRLKLDRNPVFRAMLTEKLLRPSDPNDVAVLQDEAAAGCGEVVGMISLQKLIAADKS